MEEEDKGTTIVDEVNNSTLTYFRAGGLKFKPCMSLLRYEKVKLLLEQLVECGIYLNKLLDVGSGESSFLHLAAVKLPCITEFVCIDKAALKYTRDKAVWQPAEDRRMLQLNVKVIEGDFLKLPRPAVNSDIVTLIEVLEHMQLAEVPRLMWNIFAVIKPTLVVITTPNTDFNIDFPTPDGSQFRHYDHKFEWSTHEFKRFCDGVCSIFPKYNVAMTGCGLGKNGRYCTQIAVYMKRATIPKDMTPVANALYKTPITELLQSNKAEKNEPDDREAVLKPELYGDECMTDNERNIVKILQVLRALPRPSAAAVPNANDGDKSQAISEAAKTPSTPDYYTEDFILVQEAVYYDAQTMMQNEIVYHIGCFIWSLDARNTVYPYTDKLRKVDRKWDYLSALAAGPKETVKPVRVVKASIKGCANKTCYTDDDDGACNSSHRSYTIKCDKCPFIYVNKVELEEGEATPKQLTRQLCQSNIIYYKDDRTLWFSFVLIKRYLGLGNDHDSTLRKSLEAAKCKRCFLLNSQAEYYRYELQHKEDEPQDEVGRQAETANEEAAAGGNVAENRSTEENEHFDENGNAKENKTAEENETVKENETAEKNETPDEHEIAEENGTADVNGNAGGNGHAEESWSVEENTIIEVKEAE